MKKYMIIAIFLSLALLLSACGAAPIDSEDKTVVATEAPAETTEPEIEPEPEWLSEDAIDEAYTCLFPAEGEKNVEFAQEILLPLVENGNAEAMYYWGYIYDWEIVDNNGEGEKESLYWCELAAEQGFAKAYLSAALNAYIDEERVNELIEKATQAGLFEQTPEELGADGCDYIGSYYYGKENYGKAIEWWLKASDLGSAVAMGNIGYCYWYGVGVEKNYATSVEWYLKAANRGNVYAMNNYGYALCQEDVAAELVQQGYFSTEREIHETAMKWFHKAADLGHAGSMNSIGYYAYEDNGNVEEKIEWYQNAANEGIAVAMSNLGWAYYQEGKREFYGFDSFDNAMKWYIKAYANGIDSAKEDIEYMLARERGVDGYFENYAELIFATP